MNLFANDGGFIAGSDCSDPEVLENLAKQAENLFVKVLLRMCEPPYTNFWERTPMATQREPLPYGLDKFADEHREEFQQWLIGHSENIAERGD